MIRINAILFIFMSAILIPACNKADRTTVVDSIQIRDGQINKMLLLSDSIFAVAGGERWKNGFLYFCNIPLTACVKVEGPPAQSDFFLRDIFYDQNKGVLMLAGYGGQLFRSDNNGLDWEFVRELNFDSFECVTQLNDGTVLIGGGAPRHSGFVYRSEKSAWWDLTYDNLPCRIVALHPVADNQVLAAGEGALLSSFDSGLSWSRTVVSGDYFNAFSAPNDTNVFLSGALGSLWKSTDSAKSWNQLWGPSSFKTKGFYFDLSFYDENHGIIVGLDGAILYTNDSGKTLQSFVLETGDDLYAALMLSQSSALVAGSRGVIYSVKF